MSERKEHLWTEGEISYEERGISGDERKEYLMREREEYLVREREEYLVIRGRNIW